MRITIDTREDNYEDALGVLRRAYGRHRLARKAGEPAVPGEVEVSNSGERAKGSGVRSASGDGRQDVEPMKGRGKAPRRPASKRTSATRGAAVDSPVSKSTVKGASGKKAARSAHGHGRPEAPRKRAVAGAAANTAPRGESEAVRAWAHAQGLQVRDRGRMPAKVIAAYLDAHEE